MINAGSIVFKDLFFKTINWIIKEVEKYWFIYTISVVFEEQMLVFVVIERVIY